MEVVTIRLEVTRPWATPVIRQHGCTERRVGFPETTIVLQHGVRLPKLIFPYLAGWREGLLH